MDMKQVSVVRVCRGVLVTAVVALTLLPRAARAQEPVIQVAAIPEPAAAPPPQAAPAPAPVVTPVSERQAWTVAGFVGSSWSASGNLAVQNAANGGVTYGGQISRTWGYVGAEFLTEFAPTFKMSSLLLADSPNVNTYMANAIVKGSFRGIQPYLSGGFGGVQMHANAVTNVVNASPVVTSSSQMKAGTNVGGGFFAFAAQWGIRGDIRYYKTSTSDPEKLTNGVNDFAQTLLSNLNFWRANMGIAFRW
jgi:hypothetical protein